jgi:isoleucyl-tRNA synthetase
VLTHGFTVDDKGRKMSKSLGNGIEPQDIWRTLGADMLRLWVAATDYANEMSLSQEILKRMADSYRRMRNTVRFLLGNLHDFQPEQALAATELVALDRWAINRTRELHDEICAAYRDYTFHLVYQKVHNFCVVDLGGFYLDILKDRLYTLPAGGHARRSAQTAMWHVTESIVRWLAPVLAFTAEEMWRHLHGPRAASVFLSTWHELPQLPAELIDWPALMALRADVARELERLRAAGEIGAPLDAQLHIWATPQPYRRLRALGDELRFFMITSKATVHELRGSPQEPAPALPPAGAVAAPGFEAGEVWIQVQADPDPKCVRCWQRRPDVGASEEHPLLCARCITNLALPGEQRQFC